MLCNKEVISGRKKATKQPSVAVFEMQIRIMSYYILLKFVLVFSWFLSYISENGTCPACRHTTYRGLCVINCGEKQGGRIGLGRGNTTKLKKHVSTRTGVANQSKFSRIKRKTYIRNSNATPKKLSKLLTNWSLTPEGCCGCLLLSSLVGVRERWVEGLGKSCCRRWSSLPPHRSAALLSLTDRKNPMKFMKTLCICNVLDGGGRGRFMVACLEGRWCLYHRITESQNSRGWKGPLWVI